MPMGVAELIRQKRLARHLSQRALGKAVGVTKMAVSLWESGDTMPTTKHLFEVARFLEISLTQIIEAAGLPTSVDALLDELDKDQADLLRGSFLLQIEHAKSLKK